MAQVCRYGRKCTRQDCWFGHPDSREIDERGQTSLGYGGAAFSGYAAAADPNAEFWFPKAKDCSCCQGFIYSCSEASCQSLGICGCSYEEDDDQEREDDLRKMESLQKEIEADQSWKDEWFPSSRTCDCCSGYVYRCDCSKKGSLCCSCFDAKTKTTKNV